MAVTSAPYSLLSGAKVVRDTSLAATFQTAVGASAVLYLIQADNSANAAQVNYLKLWNNASPTVGTTAPDMIVRLPAGSTVKLAITGDDADGVTFGTAITMACVQEAGTAGTSAPTSAVSVVLVVV